MSSFRLQTRQLTFVRILIPFVIGIYLGTFISFSLSSYGLSIAGATIILIFITVKNKTLNRCKWRKFKGWAINLSFLLFGICATGLHDELLQPKHFSKQPPTLLHIRMIEPPIRKGSVLKFKAQVLGTYDKQNYAKATGQLLVSLNTNEKYHYGDQFLVSSKFKLVDPPQNPYEFDYKNYLKFKNVHYQVYCKENEFRFLKSMQAFDLTSWSIAVREKCVEVFNQYIPKKENAAIVSAFLLGYRADLSEDIVSAFTNTGTLHILSVSGLHVAIIYVIINFLLSFLNRLKKGKPAKMLTILGLIWLYAIVTGLSPAVCRSAFMISVVVIAEGMNRFTNIYNTIAVSLFFLLLLDPYLLFDVGFQLSYLAVFGIVYFQPKIYNQIQIENKWIDKIWIMTSVSIAAQLVTFPLSLYYFHQFPNYFLIANMLIIPIASIVLYGGILLLLLAFVPFIGNYLGLVLSKIIDLMNWLLLKLSHLPGAVFDSIWITQFELITLTALLISLGYLFMVKDKKRTSIVIGVLITCFCISRSYTTIAIKSARELIIFASKGKSIVALKDYQKTYLFSEKAIPPKVFDFSLKPYLEHTQNPTEFSNFDTSYTAPHLAKHKNYIQFYNIRIGIINRAFKANAVSKKLKLDYLLISENAKIELHSLLKSIEFKQLIIDHSVNEINAHRIERECEALNIPCLNTQKLKAIRINI